jgi:hypothetical protein
MSLTSQNLVTPKAGVKHELLFNKLASEATLVAQQSATKIIFLAVVNLVTHKAGAKHEL